MQGVELGASIPATPYKDVGYVCRVVDLSRLSTGGTHAEFIHVKFLDNHFKVP